MRNWHFIYSVNTPDLVYGLTCRKLGCRTTLSESHSSVENSEDIHEEKKTKTVSDKMNSAGKTCGDQGNCSKCSDRAAELALE